MFVFFAIWLSMVVSRFVRRVKRRRKPSGFKRDGGFGAVGPRMSTPEMKCVDTVIAQIISTTFVATPLNLLAVGGDNFNRIGKRTVGKYLKVRLSFPQSAPVALNVADHCRVIIVYDSQVNGAGASFGQIMQSFSSAGAASGTSYSHQNPDNQDRFLVLYDSSTFLPSGATATNNVYNDGGMLTINRTIPLRNLNTVYAAATALITSVTTGSLYIYSISQNNVLGNAAFTLTGEIRYAFTDA